MSEDFKAEPGDRRADLSVLRQIIVTELSDDGHRRGCECDCNVSARDGRIVATLSAELRKINLELEKLPAVEGADPLDANAAAVADEVAAQRAKKAASPPPARKPRAPAKKRS